MRVLPKIFNMDWKNAADGDQNASNSTYLKDVTKSDAYQRIRNANLRHRPMMLLEEVFK